MGARKIARPAAVTTAEADFPSAGLASGRKDYSFTALGSQPHFL